MVFRTVYIPRMQLVVKHFKRYRSSVSSIPEPQTPQTLANLTSKTTMGWIPKLCKNKIAEPAGRRWPLDLAANELSWIEVPPTRSPSLVCLQLGPSNHKMFNVGGSGFCFSISVLLDLGFLSYLYNNIKNNFFQSLVVDI